MFPNLHYEGYIIPFPSTWAVSLNREQCKADRRGKRDANTVLPPKQQSRNPILAGIIVREKGCSKNIQAEVPYSTHCMESHFLSCADLLTLRK